MSRHEFVPPGWPATCSFAVGWDRPLNTYFAQVFDHAISEDDDRVIVWLGGMPPYHTDLDAMMRAVNARLGGKLPAIALPEPMRATLISDRQRSIKIHEASFPPVDDVEKVIALAARISPKRQA